MPNKESAAFADHQEFIIQHIYVKDLSYEAPNTPHIFSDEWRPEVNVDLNIEHEKLTDNLHEVVLRVTLTAKKADKTLFITEVKQAGIFMLKGFAEPELEQILKAMCPTILFPYAREEISSRIAKGNFPPIYLAPVNFDALYLQHRAQAAKDEKITTH